MSNTPVRARKSVFFLIPLGALAGMALAMLNYQQRLAPAVEPGEEARFVLWTLIGGAVLGGSFACPASVAAFLSAGAGKPARFSAMAAGLALALCWLLYAGVSSGTVPLALLVPAAVLSTAAGAAFIWITARSGTVGENRA